MTKARCKELMAQVGAPESRSLMTALYQVANETGAEWLGRTAALAARLAQAEPECCVSRPFGEATCPACDGAGLLEDGIGVGCCMTCRGTGRRPIRLAPAEEDGGKNG